MIIGLLIGSFLNVCIYRIPKKESIAFPQSHCPKCDVRLKPRDLIPIFSYLSTKGKCRYCGEEISPQYPIIELLNGFLYLFLYLKFGLSLVFIKYAVLGSMLIVITMIDLRLQIIPDEIIIFGLISGIIFNLFDISLSIAINRFLGFLVGGGIFLLIAIITRGAMGGGDIKLMGVLGLWLGLKYILVITLLSFIVGAFVSIILMALKLKTRKDFIPFGPFIAVSSMLVLFYGPQILQWYSNSIV